MMTVLQWFLSWRERPVNVSRRGQAQLNNLVVAVNVPVFNEDRALLDRCLYGLFSQTRLPNLVQVVDDGSAVDYSDIRAYWLRHAPPGSQLSWVRQQNQGKKHAQARTFRSVRADILVTLDSDTALERRAIEEGLKPFADSRVQSVAGLELAFNHRRNWLTRLSGTRSLIWQLLSCSSQSVLGDLLVNRGTFALYRAPVIQDNLDAYLYETFFGNPVHLGDDAALTLFARGRGRAVQQPSAFQLAMYPENFSHLFRQWTRWMRGSTVRTFWRLRYLPIMSWSWWFTVISLWAFLASSGAVIAAGADWHSSRSYVVTTLIATAACAYAQAVRIFSVVRSDESWFGRCSVLYFGAGRRPVGAVRTPPAALLWRLHLHAAGMGDADKKVEVGIGSAAEENRTRSSHQKTGGQGTMKIGRVIAVGVVAAVAVSTFLGIALAGRSPNGHQGPVTPHQGPPTHEARIVPAAARRRLPAGSRLHCLRATSVSSPRDSRTTQRSGPRWVMTHWRAPKHCPVLCVVRVAL